MITASHLPAHPATHPVHVSTGFGIAIVVVALTLFLLWLARRLFGGRSHSSAPAATGGGGGGLVGPAALIVAAVVAWNMRAAPRPHATAARPVASPVPRPVVTHIVTHVVASSSWLPGWGIILALIITVLGFTALGIQAVHAVPRILGTLRDKEGE